MNPIRLMTGLAVIVVALLASTGMATAEFTGEATKGKGEFIEFNLEAGGAKILCVAFSKGASELTWKITNGKEEVKKGSHLTFSTSKWGTCTASAPKLESSKATLSGCELEVTEAKEEFEVAGKDVTKCTIEASGCTISLEPKENEKLTNFALYPSGEKGKNLVVEPTVKNVATTVSEKCASLGVKATKEGHLEGAVEMQQVTPQLAGEFWLTASQQFFNAANPTGLLLMTRAGGAGLIMTKPIVFISHIPGRFTVPAAEIMFCEEQTFAATESCGVFATYNAPMTGGRADLLVAGPNNVGSLIIVRGL